MKKASLFLLGLITFIFVMMAVTSFTAMKNVTDKTAATVEVHEGLSIFVMCKPVNDFEVLGVVFSEKPLTVGILNGQVRELKKQFPEADGLIFDLDMSRGEAIKFK